MNVVEPGERGELVGTPQSKFMGTVASTLCLEEYLSSAERVRHFVATTIQPCCRKVLEVGPGYGSAKPRNVAVHFLWRIAHWA